MLNGVNNNINEDLNNAQLQNQIGIGSINTNSVTNPYKNLDKNLLIDETAISSQAISLYQKDQDITKFNNLAMSNPEDLSHEQIVEGLFNKGVTDIFSDEVLSKLSNNKQLLSDIDF